MAVGKQLLFVAIFINRVYRKLATMARWKAVVVRLCIMIALVLLVTIDLTFNNGHSVHAVGMIFASIYAKFHSCCNMNSMDHVGNNHSVSVNSVNSHPTSSGVVAQQHTLNHSLFSPLTYCICWVCSPNYFFIGIHGVALVVDGDVLCVSMDVTALTDVALMSVHVQFALVVVIVSTLWVRAPTLRSIGKISEAHFYKF